MVTGFDRNFTKTSIRKLRDNLGRYSNLRRMLPEQILLLMKLDVKTSSRKSIDTQICRFSKTMFTWEFVSLCRVYILLLDTILLHGIFVSLYRVYSLLLDTIFSWCDTVFAGDSLNKLL